MSSLARQLALEVLDLLLQRLNLRLERSVGGLAGVQLICRGVQRIGRGRQIAHAHRHSAGLRADAVVAPFHVEALVAEAAIEALVGVLAPPAVRACEHLTARACSLPRAVDERRGDWRKEPSPFAGRRVGRDGGNSGCHEQVPFQRRIAAGLGHSHSPFTVQPTLLDLRDAAVDEELGSGDVAALVRREERDGLRDFVRLTGTPQGDGT